MISKQPKAHDFTEADAGLGTASYRRLTLDTNRVLAGGKAAMRLNLMGHDSDVAGRDTIFKRRWGVAPSLALGLNSPTRVTLSFFHQNDDNLRSEEHTSELQSPCNLVCRLLLEKKKRIRIIQ